MRNAIVLLAACCLFLIVAFAPHVAAGEGELFFNPAYPSVGSPFQQIVDLNGDGVLDVTWAGSTATSSANRIFTSLGNGDGSFPPPIQSATFSGSVVSRDMVVGLFDGDALLDAAVLVETSLGDVARLIVRLGAGDGTFNTEVANFVVGLDPIENELVTADFDGDGVLDLAVSTGGIHVLLGAGDGTFGFQSLGVPAEALLRAVDVDADGDVDLLTRVDGGMQVLLGAGDGSFGAPVVTPLAFPPWDLAIGQADADALPDLAVLDTFGATAHVLLGSGDGSFAAATTVGADTGARTVELGDVDADGVLDLLLGGTGPQGRHLSVYLGDGAGGFGPADATNLGASPTRVWVAHLDGDAIPDVAARVNAGLQVLLGQGGGELPPGPVDLSVGEEPQTILAADLDRDGLPDLVTVDKVGGDVTIRLGQAAALTGQAFGPAQSFPAGPAPWDVAAADLDGDLIPDLVTVNKQVSQVSLLIGVGDGSFAAPQPWAVAAQPRGVALGDLDGDGRPEIVTSGSNGQVVSVLSNLGGGLFSAPATYPAMGAASGVALADFDLDGALDVVTANGGGGTVSVLIGNGDGSFGAPRVYSANPTCHFVEVGDVDGDGAPDLVVPDTGIFDQTSVLLNRGNGTMLPKQVYTGVRNHVDIGDLDGDGRLDLVGQSGWGLAWRRGTGKSGQLFVEPEAVPTVQPLGNFVSYVFAADLDGDGAPDVAVANEVADDVSVLFNRCGGPFVNLGAALAGTAGVPVFTGDAALVGGEPLSLVLADARPSATAYLCYGLAALELPFMGGTLLPDALTPPGGYLTLVTDGGGGLQLDTTWPVGVPPGFDLYLQTWIVDPAGPQGFAASNALRGTTP